MLRIDKELFQWEKGRQVYVDINESSPKVSCVQFYNKKSKIALEKNIINGKAEIPNSLLKENLPIVALACIKDANGTQVISRKTFKVLARVKPESYVDDDISSKDVIYDGGEEV